MPADWEQIMTGVVTPVWNRRLGQKMDWAAQNHYRLTQSVLPINFHIIILRTLGDGAHSVIVILSKMHLQCSVIAIFIYYNKSVR